MKPFEMGLNIQLFDLTNAARVRNGLSSLEWDGSVPVEPHENIVKIWQVNDYFSHENKQGKSPFDRMKDDLITSEVQGENLAYGQSSSIFAHEGLMNSLVTGKIFYSIHIAILAPALHLTKSFSLITRKTFYLSEACRFSMTIKLIAL